MVLWFWEVDYWLRYWRYILIQFCLSLQIMQTIDSKQDGYPISQKLCWSMSLLYRYLIDFMPFFSSLLLTCILLIIKPFISNFGWQWSIIMKTRTFQVLLYMENTFLWQNTPATDHQFFFLKDKCHIFLILSIVDIN